MAQRRSHIDWKLLAWLTGVAITASVLAVGIVAALLRKGE